MFFKDLTNIFSPNTPIQRIGFEDILIAIKPPHFGSPFRGHLINTLDAASQTVLIPNTISILLEESKINELIDKCEFNIHLIVYGRNATDDTVEKKYKQLRGLGFSNIFVYSGGIFEWCLLQDIYGAKMFPTTAAIGDFLRFKPASAFMNMGVLRLT